MEVGKLRLGGGACSTGRWQGCVADGAGIIVAQGHTLSEEGLSFQRLWCWRVTPVSRPSRRGSMFDDGRHLRRQKGRVLCLLVFVNGQTVWAIKIRWCVYETIDDYWALFRGVPSPDLLVSDGMPGMETAAKAEWPDVRL